MATTGERNAFLRSYEVPTRLLRYQRPGTGDERVVRPQTRR
ncbi:MAG TPA: hypothetical protein VMU53_12205 [Candidatus Sulfotelmatobacter sp.]|nr:hypothetical protein [Candidatus Sulfotelmatobacter sp.]